jgi:tight adherence protein B
VFEGDTTLYVIYAAVAICAVILAEAAYMLLSDRGDKQGTINRRMKLRKNAVSQKDVLQLLKKERGIEDGGMFSLGKLRKMRIQSGLLMPMPRFLAITTTIAGAAGVAAFVEGLGLLASAGIAAALALVLPYKVLGFRRNRRVKFFGLQLPEALELITRGLKAGHPVPVAVSMVGREMPDPIGTEFGLVSDEITYGSDLVSALKEMHTRVGHEDLPLFVTAISIQSSSGGNLREILEGLSNTIRERGKLRRKIRAISTEGRMSAYILTAVPVLLFSFIFLFMPEYYEAVWEESMTWWMIGGTVGWVVFGNFIMFKMANFKF